MELKKIIVRKMKKSLRREKRGKVNNNINKEFKIYKLNCKINLNESLEIINTTNNYLNFSQSPKENCKLVFINVNDKDDHVEIEYEKFIVTKEKHVNNSSSHFFQLL